jgi:hypothetical protein
VVYVNRIDNEAHLDCRTLARDLFGRAGGSLFALRHEVEVISIYVIAAIRIKSEQERLREIVNGLPGLRCPTRPADCLPKTGSNITLLRSG